MKYKNLYTVLNEDWVERKIKNETKNLMKLI